ncbi:hypothetical protein FA95DRAFT_1560272 [Auriscalpium vulgare]|uniref:Uncharacterized protein n=1 Tax=Auriscalpium vulgare TaxID=40419 RepID=A0ACB8RQ01_9AGAM|nr:hypothetical protein FA95DRAFT_1560272 [Auriscalpium vulgare]
MSRAHERADTKRAAVQLGDGQAGKPPGPAAIPGTSLPQPNAALPAPTLLVVPPLQHAVDVDQPLHRSVPSGYTEARMLECGVLTRQDLNLQVHGSAMPYLGPYVTSAEDLLALVDHQEASNAARNTSPLTSYEAHRDPFTREDRRFAAMVQESFEEAILLLRMR